MERGLQPRVARAERTTVRAVCSVSSIDREGDSGWATSHCDVFRAAVVMAPVGNIETHYGTSDGGFYAGPFCVASKPRFERRIAQELSPLHYIEASTTPTLFLQGKDDERCPKCQAEELFVSLCRAGTVRSSELARHVVQHAARAMDQQRAQVAVTALVASAIPAADAQWHHGAAHGHRSCPLRPPGMATFAAPKR